MTSRYDLSKSLSKVPWRDIIPLHDRASDELVRLDERLAWSGSLASGFRERSHLFDACAALWLKGDLVHLEDLVLHDAFTDARTPTHEITRAAAYLRRRRLVASRGRDWPLSGSGLAVLCGHVPEDEADSYDADGKDDRSRSEPNPDLLADIDAVLERSRNLLDDTTANRPLKQDRERHELIYEPEWDEGTRLAHWQAVYNQTEDLPPLVGAALSYDAWLAIQPVQLDHGLSRLIAAAILRARCKTRHHLFAINVGMRHAIYRRRPTDNIGRRIAGFLEAVETGARRGLEDLQKVVLARDVMLRHCERRRRNSNLPKLVSLFVSRPLVSVPMAAKVLKVSPQAVEKMLGELSGALPRELTGRGRFRAWGIL